MSSITLKKLDSSPEGQPKTGEKTLSPWHPQAEETKDVKPFQLLPQQQLVVTNQSNLVSIEDSDMSEVVSSSDTFTNTEPSPDSSV